MGNAPRWAGLADEAGSCRGLCRYEGLKDGTLSLEDVALMNDALTVQEENERRFMAAKEKERA